MGTKSSTQSDSITQNIDKHLRICDKESRCIYSYLLLGTKSSGKTTILKQMGFNYHGQMTLTQQYPDMLHCIRQHCISVIIKFCSIIHDHDTAQTLQTLSTMDHLSDLETSKQIMKHIYDSHIDKLSKSVSKNTLFYLAKIDDIMTEDYYVTRRDITAYHSYSGVTELQFDIKDNQYKFIDIGSNPFNIQSYIHLFDNVHAVIYIVSLSDYCVTTKHGNAMMHSLNQFTEIVQSKRLQNSEWIVFLNKVDIFYEKLKEGISLSVCFGDEWKGPEFLHAKIPLIVSHVVRCIIPEDKLISIDILRIIEKYTTIRYEIDGKDCDEDEYFGHCYETSLYFIQNQFHQKWSEVMGERQKEINFFDACAMDPDDVQRFIPNTNRYYRDPQIHTRQIK